MLREMASVRMLSHGRDEMARATITYHPYDPPETRDVFVLEDRAALLKLYDMIAETHQITVRRHPDGGRCAQGLPDMLIEIRYKDGSADIFQDSGTPCRFFRFLYTSGGGGEYGYIIGTNELLWDYLIRYTEYDIYPPGAR